MGLTVKNGDLISVDMTAQMITDSDMSGKEAQNE